MLLQTSADQKKFIEETLALGEYYRKTQIWPKAEDFNYEGWLDNFLDTGDKYLASVILSFFTYYSDEIIRKLLYDSIGNACGVFYRAQNYWNINDYKQKNYYSYVSSGNPTDSGFIFTRMARDILHIPETQILAFEELRGKLDEGFERKNVVLMDDFIGYGSQCISALGKTDANGISLYNLIKERKHIVVYAPLVANEIGVKNIKKSFPQIFITPAYTLGEEYNLFSERCICWERDHNLFKAGVEMIRRTSRDCGIPEAYPQEGNELDTRGYKNQGVALGFSHGIPDAVPGFFYYSDNGWTPLMKRIYERF